MNVSNENKVVFKDRILVCADCGKEFVFTEGEQKYFWVKGLSDPKRCKPCRMIRRRTIITMQERSHEEEND